VKWSNKTDLERRERKGRGISADFFWCLEKRLFSGLPRSRGQLTEIIRTEACIYEFHHLAAFRLGPKASETDIFFSPNWVVSRSER